VAPSSGQPGHPLLVSVRDDQGPLAILKDLLEHDDLADRLVALGDHHIQRLVQYHFLTGPERLEIDRGAEAHPHLAAAGEHIHRAVFACSEEDAEP
jgi:hypothetical protein